MKNKQQQRKHPFEYRPSERVMEIVRQLEQRASKRKPRKQHPFLYRPPRDVEQEVRKPKKPIWRLVWVNPNPPPRFKVRLQQ